MGNNVRRMQLLDEIALLRQNFPEIVHPDSNTEFMTRSQLRKHIGAIQYKIHQNCANNTVSNLQSILHILPLQDDQKKALVMAVSIAARDGHVSSAVNTLIEHYRQITGNPRSSPTAPGMDHVKINNNTKYPPI